MKHFKEGDNVNIVYSDKSQYTNVLILHLPADIGDMLEVKTKEGKLIAINTNNSNLECIEKVA